MRVVPVFNYSLKKKVCVCACVPMTKSRTCFFVQCTAMPVLLLTLFSKHSKVWQGGMPQVVEWIEHHPGYTVHGFTPPHPSNPAPLLTSHHSCVSSCEITLYLFILNSIFVLVSISNLLTLGVIHIQEMLRKHYNKDLNHLWLTFIRL